MAQGRGSGTSELSPSQQAPPPASYSPEKNLTSTLTPISFLIASCTRGPQVSACTLCLCAPALTTAQHPSGFCLLWGHAQQACVFWKPSEGASGLRHSQAQLQHQGLRRNRHGSKETAVRSWMWPHQPLANTSVEFKLHKNKRWTHAVLF